MGIVHRDLKPANLLIALKGGEQPHYLEGGALPATLLNAEIKVADFGFAKVILQSRVEASGVISGTPAYMAPEQFRGELPGPETDIYSWATSPTAALLGSVPLGDANPMYFHLQMTPPPITGVPYNVNAAIQKAISKERRDRFPAVAEFLDAIMGILAVVSTAVRLVLQLSRNAATETTYGPAAGPAGTPTRSAEPDTATPPMPLNPARAVDTPRPVIDSARATARSTAATWHRSPPPTRQTDRSRHRSLWLRP